MSKLFTTIYIVLTFIFLVYLSVPNLNFPESSEYSRRSIEPADSESEFRRGYYNNETRAQVINYYTGKFKISEIFGLRVGISPLQLNYPPEEAQTIIRDQTRSTYLEELVLPFRQSLFINGFEPKRENDVIIVDGTTYKQKIILKLINSNVFTRLTIGVMTSILLYAIVSVWIDIIKKYTNKEYV